MQLTKSTKLRPVRVQPYTQHNQRRDQEESYATRPFRECAWSRLHTPQIGWRRISGARLEARAALEGPPA
eukprot:2644742-Prymnesium_polylepis.1